MRALESKTCRTAFRRIGATTVEFAVISPVIFLFVFGLIELARGIMVMHLLTNAARNGCRVGIIEGKSNQDITTAVNNTLTATGISGDSITVYVNDNNGDTVNAQPGDEVTVRVLVPVANVSWVPVPNYLIGNLQGKYTLRRE
jgi:Flp pilus assembly protein TadG